MWILFITMYDSLKVQSVDSSNVSNYLLGERGFGVIVERSFSGYRIGIAAEFAGDRDSIIRAINVGISTYQFSVNYDNTNYRLPYFGFFADYEVKGILKEGPMFALYMSGGVGNGEANYVEGDLDFRYMYKYLIGELGLVLGYRIVSTSSLAIDIYGRGGIGARYLNSNILILPDESTEQIKGIKPYISYLIGAKIIQKF